jgi:hypothetical protein
MMNAVIKALDSPRVIRITYDEPESWMLWGMLEERIKVVTPELAPDIPVSALLKFLRGRFLQAPASLLALLVVDDDKGLIGHLIGWVDSYWDVPFAHIHQASLDRPDQGVREQAKDMVREWVKEVVAKGVSLDSIHWVSERPTGWWAFFRGKARHVRTTTILSIEDL